MNDTFDSHYHSKKANYNTKKLQNRCIYSLKRYEIKIICTIKVQQSKEILGAGKRGVWCSLMKEKGVRMPGCKKFVFVIIVTTIMVMNDGDYDNVDDGDDGDDDDDVEGV